MELSRRKLITGLVSLVAAPAIVRASSIMHVRSVSLTPGQFIDVEDIHGISVRYVVRATYIPSLGLTRVERFDGQPLFMPGERITFYGGFGPLSSRL